MKRQQIEPCRCCYCNGPCEPKAARCPWCGGYFVSAAQVVEVVPEIPLQAQGGITCAQLETARRDLNDRLTCTEINRQLYMGMATNPR